MTAALITAFAALVAALISHRVAMAGHRQAWINSLRDDLSLFFETMTADNGAFYDVTGIDLTASEHALMVTKAKRSAMLVFYRIRLRLNASEALHQTLEGALERLMVIGPVGLHESNLEEACEAARRVLKAEWNVTKSLSLWIGGEAIAGALRKLCKPKN